MPDRAWRTAAAFWEAVDAEELRFPQCSTCGRFVWYPLPRCPSCRTKTLEWVPVEPRGEVYSWTAVHRAFLPELASQLPVTVVIAQFDTAPDIRLITGLADGHQSGAVEVGVPLRIVFPPVHGEHRMPLALLEV